MFHRLFVKYSNIKKNGNNLICLIKNDTFGSYIFESNETHHDNEM